MANQYLKYCTKKQALEFLESLHLYQDIRTLYAVSNHIEKHYEYMEIPKKDGGKRILYMPDALLKGIQRNILNHVLYGMHISPYAKAYYKNAGILENAKPHVNKRVVLKLDIKDFFGSITFQMVKERIFREEYFPESISILLTILCGYKGVIPQGAPTSPMISNIILREFDEIVGNWCKESNIVYTRYCDDMTFSGTFDKNDILSFIKQELALLGFQLNDKKTKLFTLNQRQMITGIVVNEKLNTTREYRKNIRKEIYYCKKYGIENHLKFNHIDMERKEYLNSLKGKTLFVLHVDKKNQEFQKYLKWIEKVQK